MQTPSACKPAQSGYNAHDVKTRVWQIFLFPFFKFRCQNIKYHKYKYKYIFVCVCTQVAAALLEKLIKGEKKAKNFPKTRYI